MKEPEVRGFRLVLWVEKNKNNLWAMEMLVGLLSIRRRSGRVEALDGLIRGVVGTDCVV